MLPVVEGEDRPSFLDGICQDIRIADAAPRHPRFLDRHDVVTEDSPFFDDGEGEVGSCGGSGGGPGCRPRRGRGSRAGSPCHSQDDTSLPI